VSENNQLIRVLGRRLCRAISAEFTQLLIMTLSLHHFFGPHVLRRFCCCSTYFFVYFWGRL